MLSHSSHSIHFERTAAGNWLSFEETHLDSRAQARFEIRFKHGNLEAVFEDLTTPQRDAKMAQLRGPQPPEEQGCPS